MAPMRTATPEKAQPAMPDKQPKGPKGYQEVGCGTVSLYDAERKLPANSRCRHCRGLFRAPAGSIGSLFETYTL
jgi:hypothetical protein